MHCEVNNGLSEESMEQLKDKTGEEIVDADIASQLGTRNDSLTATKLTEGEKPE